MRTTNSVVVARTDETKMSSGRERKREAMSKSPIDETLLATWQRHNSSMGVYQRITEVSKQAGSLIVRMSHYRHSCACGCELDRDTASAKVILDLGRKHPLVGTRPTSA